MAHHGAGLRRALKSEELPPATEERLLSALVADFRTGDISPADRTLLAYVVKLTGAPAEITEPDMRSLRAVGFDDRAIHDACVIASYYAFVNRVANGLGVELEPRFCGGEPSG